MFHHVHCMKKHCFRLRNSFKILNCIINVDYFITINHLIINISDFSQKFNIFSLIFNEKHLQHIINKNFKIHQDSNNLKFTQSFYLQVSINSHLMKVWHKLVDIKPHKLKCWWLIQSHLFLETTVSCLIIWLITCKTKIFLMSFLLFFSRDERTSLLKISSHRHIITFVLMILLLILIRTWFWKFLILVSFKLHVFDLEFFLNVMQFFKTSH